MFCSDFASLGGEFTLVTVCDEYFVAALEEMCERWSISEDVAGATFMAAGGSAPELFTSMLGVFVAESEVGFGTIIGSAVFNVLFVIGLCAVFAKQALELTWWPLARDCSFYVFGLLVLVLCVEDDKVTWVESLILLLCYFVYVFLMKNNEKLHMWVLKKISNRQPGKVEPEPIPQSDEAGNPIPRKYPGEYSRQRSEEEQDGTALLHRSFSTRHAVGSTSGVVAFQDFKHQAHRAMMRGGSHLKKLVHRTESELKMTNEQAKEAWVNGEGLPKTAPLPPISDATGDGKEDADGSEMTPVQQMPEGQKPPSEMPPSEGGAEAASSAENKAAEDAAVKAVEAEMKKQGSDIDAVAGVIKVADADDDDDDEPPTTPFEVPDGGLARAYWLFSFPLALLMWLTIPNCQNEKWKSWFGVTFAASLLWIGGFSYLMVWWASTIGYALDIPDAVMGLTILAGGTSIPDALSSVIVARNGFGDMAVSSSIGSNIFDINVGLPLPWFIKTAIVEMGEGHITIVSDGLFVSVVTLLIMVLFVVISIKCTGWVLDLRLGGVMFVLYCLFVTQSLLLETGTINL